MTAPLLQVCDLVTRFHTFAGTVNAVSGVSFDVAEGEIMGLVGESGGGKSVIGFSIVGLVDPPGRVEGGSVRFDGRELVGLSDDQLRRVRGRAIAMIFQDPMTSLNPVRTIGHQMDEMLRLHTALDAESRRARCIEMLAEVGIPEPESRLNQYPHQFSGGMRQRVVIAIALLAEPRLLIADEPTTALDVTIQAQILKLMRQRVRERGLAMILITHDLAVVSRTVDTIVVLYCGRVVEQGPTRAVIDNPAHPYTEGLIRSIPSLTSNTARLEQIPGTVPDVRNLPRGCAFRERCHRATARCATEQPELVDLGDGQRAACFHPVGRDTRAA